jgi:tRNA G18 (ribose-2'-O)-methylase SpoU
LREDVTRHQLFGPEEIEAALAAGAPLRLVLVRREAVGPLGPLLDRARAAGAVLRAVTEADLRRMRRADAACDVLGLLGPAPDAAPAEVLAARGAAWLLAGVAYAGNAGFAIRTAEVSGADGIFLDASLDAAGRRRALRAAMHAERFFPVHWTGAAAVLDAARAADRRLIAVEDVGVRAPWEVDLRGPVLILIGGEREGLPPSLVGRCDEVVRVPMAGFIPSYNLQAAMAAVAADRLRQEATGA